MFYDLIAYVFSFDAVFFRPRSIAKWVIAMAGTFSKVLLTPKRLHLEYFCKNTLFSYFLHAYKMVPFLGVYLDS